MESAFAHWSVLEKSLKLMSSADFSGFNVFALTVKTWSEAVCAPVRKDAREKMCSSRKIIWSLLVLSTLEIGLGVSSIVLGAVGICRAKAEHKTQQGDASPVWSGVCVRLTFFLVLFSFNKWAVLSKLSETECLCSIFICQKVSWYYHVLGIVVPWNQTLMYTVWTYSDVTDINIVPWYSRGNLSWFAHFLMS